MSRMFARTVAVVAAGLVLAVTAGCGSSGEDSSSADGSGSDGAKFTIAFQQPLAGQPWREMGLATLQNLANQPEYKDKVTLKISRTQDNDPAQQLAAMRNLVSEGVDGILFDPASPTGTNPAIAQAEAENIPVMAAGGTVDNDYPYVVSTDWNQMEVDGAKWLLEHMEGAKDAVVIEGFPGVPLSDQSIELVNQTLEDGGANIVARGQNNFDEGQAQKTMSEILRSQNSIDGVFSAFAGLQGIPEAFKQAGRPFVPTVGGSGYNAEACTLVKYGKQGLVGASFSGQPAIYAKGLEQMVKILEEEDVPHEQLFPPLVVDNDNAKEVCMPDRPPLFAIGYEFPGLNLPLEDTLKYFRGES